MLRNTGEATDFQNASAFWTELFSSLYTFSPSEWHLPSSHTNSLTMITLRCVWETTVKISGQHFSEEI